MHNPCFECANRRGYSYTKDCDDICTAAAAVKCRDEHIKELEEIAKGALANFKEGDFSPDELRLLRLAFQLVDDVVEAQRQGNYDTYLPNVLYSLKERLGIGDLV